jgi:long-chain fatty acid transport protein
MNFNLGVSMAYQLSETFAFGIGIDYETSTLEIERTVGLINPFNQQLTDVADAKMESTGINSGFAWNVGLLWKIGGGFTLGGVYRSGFTIDYEGDGAFNQILTGYPEFDAVIASFLPVDEKVPITTSIEFPDFWTIGLSWQNEKWTLSGQYGVMGWTSFDELAIIFPENPELSSAVPENFEDAAQYRIGGEYRVSQHVALQLGYLFDETGQPIETMSPLLADGDRTGYSAGFSYYTDRFRLDLGYLYITNDGRSTEGGSHDGYNGRYDDSKAHLAGATFTIKF